MVRIGSLAEVEPSKRRKYSSSLFFIQGGEVECSASKKNGITTKFERNDSKGAIISISNNEMIPRNI